MPAPAGYRLSILTQGDVHGIPAVGTLSDAIVDEQGAAIPGAYVTAEQATGAAFEQVVSLV